MPRFRSSYKDCGKVVCQPSLVATEAGGALGALTPNLFSFAWLLLLISFALEFVTNVWTFYCKKRFALCCMKMSGAEGQGLRNRSVCRLQPLPHIPGTPALPGYTLDLARAAGRARKDRMT